MIERKTLEDSWEISKLGQSTPVWADRIERWNQLSPEGMALCESFNRWFYQKQMLEWPDLIVQVCPVGSYYADRDFALSGGDSPSRFVYTLANIPVGLLAQFLNWKGKSFNFTGPSAPIEALEFSEKWLQKKNGENANTIWILTLVRPHPFSIKVRVEQKRFKP